VWQRRQEMPPQQATIEPTPMEGVERINVVMARLQQQGVEFSQRNLYAMDMDMSKRNCYVCGDFEHMAKYCRNREIEVNRKMEVENNSSNLNGEGGLESPN